MKYEKLSDAGIALQQELTNGMHNTLCEELVKHSDPEDRIAHIATHCGILVDGLTTIQEVDRLYYAMVDKLITLRENGAGIIIVKSLE